MKVKAHALFDLRIDDWYGSIEDKWEYSDFIGNAPVRKRLISFDSVLADPGSDLVYLGITSFNADIFRAYNRATGEFIDLGYSRVSDRFDAKFHRALYKSTDGFIYGAVALLHDVDNYWNAPGGSVVRYDPSSGSIEKIATPMQHVYIQGMAVDESRRTAYLQTFTPEYLMAFDLDTCESRTLGLTGSGYGMGQGETIVLDAKQRVWGGWSLTRAWQQSGAGIDQFRLFRYDPEDDRIEFFRHGLPCLGGKDGYAHLDGLISAPDGYLYAGSGEGGLFRINPDSAEIELIGVPCPPVRIAAFDMGPDGYLYGIGGRYGNATLFRLDLDTRKYQVLGKLYDPDINDSAWQIHDMSFAPDGTIFAGENDNIHRSSYLWEITL